MLLIKDGFACFGWASGHFAAAQKLKSQRKLEKAELARRRREERRGALSYLFQIIDFPESALTRSELRMLDAYVARQCAEIRSEWTMFEEAERRGVFIGYRDKYTVSDGRVFPVLPAHVVDTSSLEEPIDGEYFN